MNRFTLYAALAAFIAVMVLYRFFLVGMVAAYGPPFAAFAILACYALALLIHRYERGY